MKSKLMVGSALAISALAWAAKDPVVMRVNGVDVTKSEFEYLYKKNSQQQIEPQPLDKYVEMFAIYKMKVADAKANGLDTVQSIKKEMNQYVADLAAPFLADSAYLNTLVDQTWERIRMEADAKHIMLGKRSGSNPVELRQRADSIRQVLLKGGDFAELAAKYSEDRASSNRGGDMGYIVAGRFPYEFEEAVWSTPEGKYSDVVETEVGFHIIKGGKKIPARGSVTVAHIMKVVPINGSEEAQQAVKNQIDSIYNVLKEDPSKFETLARELSDDKGSAAHGGNLRPFMSGQMVPEFNEAAFSMSNGEITEPVRSMYGWHIIKRLDGHPLPGFEVMRPQIVESYTNPMSDRAAVMSKHQDRQLEKRLHASRNNKVIKAMIEDARTIGTDSNLVNKYSAPELSSNVLFTVNKQPYTVAQLLPSLRRFNYPGGNVAVNRLETSIDKLYKDALHEQAIVMLEKEQPEFRYLLNEYRDGSLLYEMSVRKVWDKAAKDKEGLEQYFNLHKSDFKWNEPHVKGYLVQASTDSVANAIRNRLGQLSEEEYLTTIRKEFANVASIDKILMVQGQNAMVDNLVFGADAATPSNTNYTTYFLYDQKVLDAPESVSDAKVMITNAYQNELENEWIDELKAKYPVEINYKELKKIK